MGYYRAKRSEVAVLLPQLRKGMRVLEIGCGEGGFVDNIQLEVEYWGVEPVIEAAKVAKERLHKVIVGEFEAVLDELPGAYFDLVICNDVIEHVYDTAYFLKAVKEKMCPEGNIVGSVPNVRYLNNLINLLVKKDWKYVEYGILDRTHLRFFTEKSLLRDFNENGLSVMDFRGINGMTFAGPSIGYRVVKTFFILLCFLCFGYDVRYPQFAFRLSLAR